MMFNFQNYFKHVDFDINNPGDDTEIIIRDGVTEIDCTFFVGNKTVRRLVIPDSVEYIRDYAFEHCIHLSEVVFGKGLKYIGDYAFQGCAMLKEIELSDSVEEIGRGAFADSGIERITLPDSIRKVRCNAFAYTPWWRAQQGKEFVMPHPSILLEINSEAESVQIPDGVVYIASNVFAPETARVVRELIIPDSVEYIEDEAFHESELRRVHLGNSVRYIGKMAFADCVQLESIDFPESLTYIGKEALDNTPWKNQCQGTIMLNSHFLFRADPDAEHIELPEGIVEIAPSAFFRAKAKSVVLPSSLRVLGDTAFCGCVNLQSVVFKEGIEDLSSKAFMLCDQLETVTIPSTVKHICDDFVHGISKTFVEFDFKVKESITEICATDSLPWYFEYNIIAPHIPVTAMGGLSMRAALGFMKYSVKGGRYDEKLIDGYNQYITEHYTQFYKYILDHPFILTYMCREKLIPERDIERFIGMAEAMSGISL